MLRPDSFRWLRHTLCFAALMASISLAAQEQLRPLQYGTCPRIESSKSVAIQLPFFDDFSSGTISPLFWDISSASATTSYDPLPPSLGMAVLDALNADGQLYPDASIGLFSADTLLSRSIRLDSIFSPSRTPLRPADSLRFSFYYLPGGGDSVMWQRYGDCPDLLDSLILEFFNPVTNHWDFIWGRGGIPVDSLRAHTHLRWQQVRIPITNPQYFSPNFRFRFRNYASLDDIAESGIVGNSDQWLLDYILLDVTRSHSDPYERDVVFVSPAPSLLQHYQAMPFRHYRPADMAPQIFLSIANLYSQPMATSYSYAVFDTLGNLLHTYDGGYANAPTFLPNASYQDNPAHSEPPVNYAFPLLSAPDRFIIRHLVREGVGGDLHPNNDTAIFEQRFSNYFAYDDGVAENGYGLVSTSSNMAFCLFYPLVEPDTLVSVSLYFNRTRNGENETIPFSIAVWSDNNGIPGDLLYLDQSPRSLAFDGLNQYHSYPLDQPLPLSEPVHIGIVQSAPGYINLGFDRNCDARDRTHYRIGNTGGWSSTVYFGALMIRPFFGTVALSASPDIDNPLPSVSFYPNPTASTLFIDSDSSQPLLCEILDLSGRIIRRTTLSSIPASIDLKALPSGIYIVRLISNQGAITRKLFKQ